MTGRERILAAVNHKAPDMLPMDFGGGLQTGMHVSVVYQLRQHLGLDAPGTPVKVVEVYQMLGEIAEDLRDALGVDTACLAGTGTMFGYPASPVKEWQLEDGTPVLVPEKFNTEREPNGDLFQYPEGDRSAPPSGRMPAGGHFFDAIVRQEPLDESALNPEDNTEEFGLVDDAELAYLAGEAKRLREGTDRAVFCTFGGLAFGDIALVPAVQLKRPKGIRDLQEWYMATLSRPDYVKAVFERQCEVAVENLARLHAAVGDNVDVIQTSGTDFGTQGGPFCSREAYCDCYLPYQKRVNGWIHANTPWKTFMHCCGGIEPLLEDIIDAEFDILNPVQCSAAGMAPSELKRKYGSRLAFWGGGVDTQRTLPFGTPEQVRDEVRQRIEVLGENGGYVFCPIHNVVANVPLENVLAMLDVVRAHRQ